jgi:hypothetical protein
MRFFTPELYVAFNASDDAAADRADAQWEEVTEAYRRHIDAIRTKLPSEARFLVDGCLHDADVLAFAKDVPLSALPQQGPVATGHWMELAVLSLKVGETLHTVVYILSGQVSEKLPGDEWPFSRAKKTWLYDEIDVSPTHSGEFVHRILFSDGSVAEIPFTSAFEISATLPQSDQNPAKRRSA